MEKKEKKEKKEEEDQKALAFYRYFDLSNQQLFLARRKRISKKTREDWKEGIAGNLELPEFRKAWERLVRHLSVSDFEDLRRLPRPYSKADPPWLRLRNWLLRIGHRRGSESV